MSFGGGQGSQPSWLMVVINRGGYFLLTEAGFFTRLKKSIYGGGCFKTTAYKNILFLEMVV